MNSVAKWTIKQRKWSVFWWSFAAAALIILTLAFYPTFRDQAAELEKSISHLSDSTIALFSDTKQIFSPVGYLSSQIFYLLLPMLLSILTIGLGSSLIAREEDSGTIELLLSRPISRSRLIAGKALAGLLVLVVVCAVSIISLLIMSALVKIEVPLLAIAATALSSAALALLLGSISFAITCMGRTARLASIGVAALVGIGGYIISSLSAVVNWLHWPAIISPFHYYHPAEILGGNYHWPELIGFFAASVILGIFAWYAFRRRDLGGS